MASILGKWAFRDGSRCHGDLLVAQFHKALRPLTLEQTSAQFESGQLRCIVATVAFGLGIDIPTVRHVCLFGVPRSPAEAWQLLGHAGRDGLQATGHIYLQGTVDPPMASFVQDVRQKKVCVTCQAPSG
jgi:superfamily II DNA helicase RecQ